MASIRSKHNNLLNYFICDRRLLSKAYVRKCEKFLTRNKRAGSIPPALKQGHGRAYYTNGPLVAGASSLPAKPSSRNKK